MSVDLTQLKSMQLPDLIKQAETCGANVARQRKQDIIFSILKTMAKQDNAIHCDGVLEIMSEGFGFLRSINGSYLANACDIYVSPNQIKRFYLKTGDTISGTVRPPKDNERYFALLKVEEINFNKPEQSRQKVDFENLTPLFPNKRLQLERESQSSENITPRIMDLIAPIGKGQRSLIVAPPKAGKTMMLQNAPEANKA